jgi:hypothetical protein
MPLKHAESRLIAIECTSDCCDGADSSAIAFCAIHARAFAMDPRTRRFKLLLRDSELDACVAHEITQRFT